MKKSLFDDLINSLEQAAAHAGGKAVPGLVVHEPPGAEEIAAIRIKAGLTRKQFAAILGAAPGTLRKWEDGTRAPSGAARTLLLVLKRNPRAVLKALAA
jgi:putative transcriptional regulator